MKKSILLCALLLSFNINAGNLTPSELKESRYETLNCSTDEQCERKAEKRVVSLEKQVSRLEESLLKAEAKIQAKKDKITRLKGVISNLKGE